LLYIGAGDFTMPICDVDAMAVQKKLSLCASDQAITGAHRLLVASCFDLQASSAWHLGAIEKPGGVEGIFLFICGAPSGVPELGGQDALRRLARWFADVFCLP